MISSSSYSEADLSEAKRIRALCNSTAVNAVLDDLISRIQSSLPPVEKVPVPTPIARSEPVEDVTRYAKITGYSWEHQKTVVKLYVTFPGANAVAAEHLRVNFTSNTVEVIIRGSDERWHRFFIRTVKNIIPEKCTYRTTEKRIILTLAKSDDSLWNQLERKEEKTPRVPKVDKDADPSKSLMDMMKTMYEDGDEETKRMIAKSWTEAQSKKGNPSAMDDFEGLSKK